MTLAAAATLVAASAASATPIGLEDCRAVEGTHQCSGLVETWDGVPLDATLTLPREGARKRPLIVLLHGFGNSKHAYLNPAEQAYTGNAYAWARRGYAVLTHTARGLWGSCGTPEARLANPSACARAYIRLADVRYEVRDAQHLIGLLVDAGVADRRAIGVTGDSYGGGQSLSLAALRGRTMLPDGRLVPWRSPEGRRLAIAASAPVIPWSDLVTAAAPNGRVSSTRVTTRAQATTPVGVAKATFVSAIFAAGQLATGPGEPVGDPWLPLRPMGHFALPGTDRDADVTAWVTRTLAGEPYTDDEARRIVDDLARHHSPYYVDASRRPPPLLLAAGFTDDLFPASESLRFANRTERRHPRTPLSLLLGDFGHQRAQNKAPERRTLVRSIARWMDHHVRGRGRAPRTGATAFAQTCPGSRPPLGPFKARSFARLAPRGANWRFDGGRSVGALGLDPAGGVQIDPVTGGGDGCAQVVSAPLPGTARLPLKRAGEPALTMIGAPRIAAKIEVLGARPGVAQIAGRLWDVAPDGVRRLVARGSFRPLGGQERWELQPGAWRFERGHAAELELLGGDPPYLRPSNGTFEAKLSALRVRLPRR